MANYCWYQVRAKGRKKSVLFLYHSMPANDDLKVLLKNFDDPSKSEIIFSGSCKWSLDAYCENSKPTIKINVDDFIDEDDLLSQEIDKYIYYTLKDKSKILDLEIEAFSEYEDYDYKSDMGDRPLFQHYLKGDIIKEEELSFTDAQNKAKELFGIDKVIPNYYDENYEEEFYDESEEYDGNGFASYKSGEDIVLLDYKNSLAEEILIPDDITFINEGFGYGYNKLKKVVIPRSVLTIDFDCFSDLTNLSEVIMEGNPEILEGSFSNCPNLVIKCNSSSKDVIDFANKNGIKLEIIKD